MTMTVVTRRQCIPIMVVMSTAPFAVAMAWLATRGHLPSRIPEQPSVFNWRPSPESPAVVMKSAVVLSAVEVLVIWGLFLVGVLRRFRLWWLNFLVPAVWINPAWAIGTLIGAVGAGSYEAAAGRSWPFPASIAVMGLAGAIMSKFARVPRVTSSGLPLPMSSLRLKASERAVWTGTASNRMRFAFWLLFIGASIALVAIWPFLWLLPLFGVGGANTSGLRVQTDGRGVQVRMRWSPWRIQNIALPEIASAGVTPHLTGWQEFERIDQEARDRNVTKVRIRAGPALMLVLHSGQSMSISLDGADRAADVVNAMIVRLREDERTHVDHV